MTYINAKDVECGDLIMRLYSKERTLILITKILPPRWGELRMICNIYHFNLGATSPTEIFLNESTSLSISKMILLSRIRKNDAH